MMMFPDPLAPSPGKAVFDLTAAPAEWEDLKYREILEHFTAALGVNIQDYLRAHVHEMTPTAAAMVLFLRDRYQDSMGTMTTYASNLCQFFNHVRMPFHLVSRYDVENYLLQMQERGQKAKTINTKLSTLKSFYKFMVGEGAIERDPAAAFRARKAKSLPGHHTKVLGLEDVKTLVEHVRKNGTIRDYCMVAMMFFTGVRAIEVTRLCWGDITRSISGDGKRGWYARVLGKGSKERMVYLPEWMVDRLMKYRFAEYRVQLFAPAPALDRLPVFPNMKNTAKPLGTQAIYKIVKQWGRLALGREISPHWGRHSFTTNAKLRGATWDDLQQQLGHASITTVEQYQHSQHLRQSAAGEVFDDAPDGATR